MCNTSPIILILCLLRREPKIGKHGILQEAETIQPYIKVQMGEVLGPKFLRQQAVSQLAMVWVELV